MNGPEQTRLTEAICDSLQSIIDPEIGENIVDLGLIYGISVSGAGHAVVTMTTTSRGCPATGYLRTAVAERARRIGGIASVSVELTYDPLWSPEMINARRVALRPSAAGGEPPTTTSQDRAKET